MCSVLCNTFKPADAHGRSATGRETCSRGLVALRSGVSAVGRMLLNELVIYLQVPGRKVQRKSRT